MRKEDQYRAEPVTEVKHIGGKSIVRVYHYDENPEQYKLARKRQ